PAFVVRRPQHGVAFTGGRQGRTSSIIRPHRPGPPFYGCTSARTSTSAGRGVRDRRSSWFSAEPQGEGSPRLAPGGDGVRPAGVRHPRPRRLHPGLRGGSPAVNGPFPLATFRTSDQSGLAGGASHFLRYMPYRAVSGP